jgi:hypothetical protein
VPRGGLHLDRPADATAATARAGSAVPGRCRHGFEPRGTESNTLSVPTANPRRPADGRRLGGDRERTRPSMPQIAVRLSATRPKRRLVDYAATSQGRVRPRHRLPAPGCPRTPQPRIGLQPLASPLLRHLAADSQVLPSSGPRTSSTQSPPRTAKTPFAYPFIIAFEGPLHRSHNATPPPPAIQNLTKVAFQVVASYATVFPTDQPMPSQPGESLGPKST